MILTEERKIRIQELINNIPDERWKEIENRIEELSENNGKLSKDIIDGYNFKFEISKPDWDDVEIIYTLPNGLRLSTLTVCGNEPCKVDSLEGLDGCIYITKVSELNKLVNMSLDEILHDVVKEHKDFNIEDYR